ncbi:hypothetical protein PB1_05717 [Bacillus methanolicus PB1]|uniref:Uncharacterized protein n=1 Tax=Bacillus methanolicus PB1 TaxID=997296 RepID=I3E017_BACMT|nr:hypothetical protein [Bacillus methanolicus]EIJ79838.1 hypothetical protein PB1_05717 [Bacillus methanolicus PB1]
MKYVQNEKGNATFYLLWLLGIVAIIFVLIINIVKVYIVKEHANLAVEQAALAGTAVLLEKTKEAVEEFDTSTDPLYLIQSGLQKSTDNGNSVGDLIEEKKKEYMDNGADEADAYIKAANEILPEKLQKYSLLKYEFTKRFGSSGSEIPDKVRSTVQDIIIENKANTGDTEIEFSQEKWRLEIKSTTTFESISDHKFISKFLEDIPQEGYGPTLKYLESVYTETGILP